MTLNITPAEQQVLIDSMRDRIDKLYRIAESYHHNEEARRDCMDEKNRVQNVLAKVRAL